MADWGTDILTELSVRDPFWLSDIRQKYEKYVDLLLKSSDPALVGDLEPQQLEIFRNTYGGRSYSCRIALALSLRMALAPRTHVINTRQHMFENTNAMCQIAS